MVCGMRWSSFLDREMSDFKAFILGSTCHRHYGSTGLSLSRTVIRGAGGGGRPGSFFLSFFKVVSWERTGCLPPCSMTYSHEFRTGFRFYPSQPVFFPTFCHGAWELPQSIPSSLSILWSSLAYCMFYIRYSLSEHSNVFLCFTKQARNSWSF